MKVLALDPATARPVAPSRARRLLLFAALATVIGGLFLGYLSMSRTMGVNADGASNALQAYDMLRGNVLLHGWTVTDVSFYTNELLLFAAVELVYGLHADVVHVAAALTYTLLVLVVAVAAKGRATGREAAVRIGAAVAIMGVPASGWGASILLLSPDHTGTGIPLVLAWVLLERALSRRWLPYAIAAVLAWGQVADPLIMFVGALPLIVVGLVRLVRDRGWRPWDWRGLDARLVLAGVGSVILAEGALLSIRLAGGFVAHGIPVQFSRPSDLPTHLLIAVRALSVDFGAYFPDRHGFAVALGGLHLLGLLAAVGALCVAVIRVVRRRAGQEGDRVADLAATGILLNVGAYIVSTLPGDPGTSRQIVAVVPLGAVLVGRVFGPRLATGWRRVRPVMAAVLLILAGELALQATTPRVPAESQDVAEWLDAHNLRYGIGGYWNANNITLITSGRVHVAPVIGDTTIMEYRWESKADWYDPTRHDARFLVIDRWNPRYGTEEAALAQFGEPISRHQFPRSTVLVYGHNLLAGLTPHCDVTEGCK